MSVILGLDTASNRMHWFANSPIFLDDDDAQGELYGWVTCTDKNPDIRRAMIFDYARQLFDRLPDGSHVFCEEPLALQNGKTTRLLGLVAGAIWAAFQVAHPDAWWHWVDVSSWKKEVLGRGAAPKGEDTKEWIRRTVMNMPGFAQFLTDPVAMAHFSEQPDLFDAWALKTYGRWFVKEAHA